MHTLKKIAQLPLFLLTIPLFIVVHTEQQYRHLIPYQFVYTAILWLFVPPLVVAIIARLLFRHAAKADVFSFVLLFMYYFFGELKERLVQHFPHAFISKYVFLLPLILALLLLTAFILKRRTASLARPVIYINVAFLLFIAADLVQMLVANPIISRDPGNHHKPIASSYKPCDTCTRPDIYYFVFDAYTASSTLQKDFGYFNPIDTILKRDGFFTIPHARSNYNLTPFSISSSLDLQYLPHLDTAKTFYMKEYLQGLYGVYNNELVPVLQQQGYTFVNHSIFDIAYFPPATKPFNIWDADLLYANMNIFRHIEKDIGWQLPAAVQKLLKPSFDFEAAADQRDQHLKGTLSAVHETMQTYTGRPRFVYAHFMLPHALYNYDSVGNRIKRNLRYLTPAEEKAAYVEQVKYSNDIILSLVSDIFASRRRHFAIIIQGDHSHRIITQQDTRDREQFTNFSAVYLSNRNYSQFNDSMTNVNTFRAVLNTLFHQQYPLLKDSFYYLKYK